MTDPIRDHLEEKREQAARDLAEIESQLDEGEIDQATFDRLTAVYRAESASLGSLEHLPPAAKRRFGGRFVAGAAVLGIGAVILAVALINSVEPRSDLAGEGAPDLSTVSNDEMEQVVAANPDIVPMRLALARRYMDSGDFSKALSHYLTVLQQDQVNVEALSYVGWISYDGGETDLAVPYLEKALELDAEYAPALWFLAILRLDGQNDKAGATELVTRLLAVPGLPQDLVAAAHDLLARASS